MKIGQQIEQQTSTKNRLITIINWNEYQQSEQQIEQQVNSNRTTSEQQVNTNKNDNNVIMKEINNNLNDSMYEEQKNGWLERANNLFHRRN